MFKYNRAVNWVTLIALGALFLTFAALLGR